LLVTSSRYNHMWVVPGGGLEPGEDPATTAVREVHEEVRGCLRVVLAVTLSSVAVRLQQLQC